MSHLQQKKSDFQRIVAWLCTVQKGQEPNTAVAVAAADALLWAWDAHLVFVSTFLPSDKVLSRACNEKLSQCAKMPWKKHVMFYYMIVLKHCDEIGVPAGGHCSTQAGRRNTRAFRALTQTQLLCDGWGRSQVAFSTKPAQQSGFHKWLQQINRTRSVSLQARQMRKNENSMGPFCRLMHRKTKLGTKTHSSRGGLKQKHFVNHRNCLLNKSSWKQQMPKRPCCTSCAELCVVCTHGLPIKAPLQASPVSAVCCETEHVMTKPVTKTWQFLTVAVFNLVQSCDVFMTWLYSNTVIKHMMNNPVIKLSQWNHLIKIRQ